MKGFWSVTLYNEHHFFHRNELHRYSLGTKNTGLRTGADGSLALHFGPPARPPTKTCPIGCPPPPDRSRSTCVPTGPNRQPSTAPGVPLRSSRSRADARDRPMPRELSLLARIGQRTDWALRKAVSHCFRSRVSMTMPQLPASCCAPCGPYGGMEVDPVQTRDRPDPRTDGMSHIPLEVRHPLRGAPLGEESGRSPGCGGVRRDEDVARLSPFVRHHINMLGRYSFQLPDLPGGLRPLSDPGTPDEE